MGVEFDACDRLVSLCPWIHPSVYGQDDFQCWDDAVMGAILSGALPHDTKICQRAPLEAPPNLGADFWEGVVTKHFSVRKGKHSVNEGFCKDFCRKGEFSEEV